jgi:hypothetical protein
MKVTQLCEKCGATYVGLSVFSVSSYHPAPKIAELKCPVCGASAKEAKVVNSESIIGNPGVMEGYDETLNLYPTETKPSAS